MSTILAASRMPRKGRRFRLWIYDRLYHELAWAYDWVAWSVSLGQWDNWRRLALQYVWGERMLEIGFGTGALLLAAQHQSIPLWGLEISAAMQRQTQRRLDKAGVVVPRLRADIFHLPLAGGSLDTVVISFPTPYILKEDVWRQLYRVLGAGGRVVVVGMVVSHQNKRYPPPQRKTSPPTTILALDACCDIATAAGFAVCIHWHQQQRSNIPIIIAERETGIS